MRQFLGQQRFFLLLFGLAVWATTAIQAVVLPRGGKQQQRQQQQQHGTTTALFLRATTTTLLPPPCTTLSNAKAAAASTKTTTITRARLPRTALAATSNNNENNNKNNESDKHRKQDLAAVTTSSSSRSSTTTSRNNVLVTAALSAITLVSVLAKLDVLPGPLLSKAATATTATANPTTALPYSYSYTDHMWQQDVTMTVLTATLGYAFVQVVTTAVGQGWLAPKDSRKVIHTLSAPLFMLFWPAFSPAPVACWMAAVVPLCNALRLVRAATTTTATGGQQGQGGDETFLARAVSRSGQTQEALGGPFIYVLWLTIAVITTWRTSPVGIVAMSTLAAGDGLADLCGRRWGANNVWPFLSRNNKKSVAGSLAFWVAATVTSVALLAWMQYWGCFTLAAESWSDVTVKVALITLVAAIVELTPIADDNYTVPFVAAVGTWWLLPVV